MDYKDAERAWAAVKKTSGIESAGGFTRAAAVYAHIRALYRLADVSGKAELERRRSAAHNAFIDACNILSRTMAAAGEDNSWRAELGDGRKVIGDFACYLHCLLGLETR